MAENVREKLKSEIMATDFAALAPHFARGALVLAAPELDILDAAEAIARDDRAQVEAWLTSGALRRASDNDARAYMEDRELRFQFVIVQPWVLAQPLFELKAKPVGVA